MDTIGHLVVLDHAGLKGDIWGDDALLGLFPNLAHCHDWGYRQLQAGAEPHTHADGMIRGHILTDWVIHYGPTVTSDKRRIGWAYEEAPDIVARMDHFFDHALAVGVADVDPRRHDDRAHLERDFGHTAAECALDLYLADNVAGTAREATLRNSLRRLADAEYARAFVDEVLEHVGGGTTEPPWVLARTASEFGTWATEARTLQDFAALTICSKLGWPFEHRTVDVVLEFLHEVSARLDRAARDRLVDQVVQDIEADCRHVVGTDR